MLIPTVMYRRDDIMTATIFISLIEDSNEVKIIHLKLVHLSL